MATKMSPGAIERLSIEMPVSGPRASPSSLPPVAARSSSIAHSSVIGSFVAHGLAHNVVVAERLHLIADDLAGLVTLAGDEKHITLSDRMHGGAYGLFTRADLNGLGV